MAPRPAAAAFVCALVVLAVPSRAGIDCTPYQTNVNYDWGITAAAKACGQTSDSLDRLTAAQKVLMTAAAAANDPSDAAAAAALETARKNYDAAQSDFKKSLDALGATALAFPPTGATSHFAQDVQQTVLESQTEEKSIDALAQTTRDSESSTVHILKKKPEVADPNISGAIPVASKAADMFAPPDPNGLGSTLAALPVTQNTSAVKAAAQSVNSGDPATAEKSMDQVLADHPSDPAALAVRAQARMAQGNSNGALADANEALKLNPNDKASRALVTELQSLNRASGKIKGAKIDFGGDRASGGGSGGGQSGARTAGGPEAAPRTLAPGGDSAASPPIVAATPAVRGLIERAQQLSGIGDYTGALLPLREALDLDPKRTELWDMLAENSNETGNFKGALAAAEGALKLNAGDARALRAQSYAEFELGDYHAALTDADRAVSLDPGNGLAYLYRAMAEEKLGQTEKALADYRKAEQLDSTVAPLADAGIKRLRGASAAAGAASPSSRMFLRGGAIAVSTLLIVLGLMGTAAGRRLTTRGARAPAPVVDDADVAKTLAIGSRLAGNYRVTRELGRGGMGVVYQAYDETLQRHVAIKQLQREGRENTGDLERFLREARLVAQLKHPHLAQIHSVINQGDLLLVFEYVEGQTLDRTLSSEKRFSPEKVRRLIGEICDALTYAHGQKIIHRDLKPSNVMLDPAGRVKIMDFGIAHQSHGNATMTQTNASGTPPYMAPEQGFGSVSKSADLFALAVMTYEMLTGVRPFRGPDFLEPKLRGEFAPATKVNPALPPSIDGFFARALAPDPTQRHTDAAEFARALNESLDDILNRA